MLGVEHVSVPEQVQAKSSLLVNSDLFDAEDSSSDEEKGPAVSSPQQTQTNRSSKRMVFSDDDDSSDSGVNDPFVRKDDDSSDSGVNDPFVRKEDDGAVRNDGDDDAGSDGEERTSPVPDVSERAKKKSKRRSKSPKPKKPRRAKKSEVQEIHSESQRIVRESSLRLPYHKPAKKTLDDFFNRKPSSPFLKPVPLRGAKKVNSLSAHKNSNGYSSKHSNNNKLQLDIKSSQSNTKDSDSLKLPGSPVEDFPIVANWLKNIEPTKADDPDGATKKVENEGPLSESQITAEPSVKTQECDPDNVQDSEEVGESLHLTGILSQTQDDESQELAKDEEGVAGEVISACKTERDSGEGETVAPVAGHKTSPDESNEGGDRSEQDNAKEPDQLANEQTEPDQAGEDAPKSDVKEPLAAKDPQSLADEKPQDPEESSKDLPVTPAAPSQPAEAVSAARRRQMLLEASLEKLKGFTPKLEGSPEGLFDLEESDDEEEERKPGPVLNPGLRKLMDRFAVHTKKPKAKKRRQVEVSVVSKAVDTDGKEDLKLDKVMTTIEGEEEEDPLLKVPGAKLLKLKDNLQERMRLKREEARKKRKELYRLDNEELLGDGEDEEEGEDTDDEGKPKRKKKEEAELTDQTDTDYDPEEDNIKDDDIEDDTDEDDDEMDEELYEERARKTCEFGDEEAEVDEDEEEYEEEGEYEEEPEDGETKKAAKGAADDGEMASGEESSDEEDDMGRRKITPTRVKRKKKLFLDEDDDEEEDEEKMVLKIPEDEPETEAKEPDVVAKDPTKAPSESSRLSIAGSNSSSLSGKISTDTKKTSASTGFDLNGSKTMDMFDSNTVTSTHTTDGENKTAGADDVSPTESKGFTWSALKKSKDENKERPSETPPPLVRLDSANSNSLDTSFEMFGSMIPAHQPGGGMRNADSTFKPFSKQKSMLESSGPKSTPAKLSELTMPVEDSQDLFREESPLPSLGITDSRQLGETQSFHFSFEEDETQTQFLDENGFLNVRPSVSKPKPAAKKLFSGSSQAAPTQNNMDELLGLCSGQFTGTQEEPRASSPKTFGGTGPFSQITKGLEASQGGMDELLGLCSGTFAKTQVNDANATESNPTKDDKKDNKDGSEASFHLVSDNEAFHSNDEDDVNEDKDKFKGLSSDEEEGGKKQEEEGAEEGMKRRRRIKMLGSSDDEAEVEKKEPVKVKRFKGFTSKVSKMIRKNFVENEAELSGSEYDSDENYDAEEFGDELELDAEADQEDLGDEEDLRNQVNKVHMKAVDDDDARQIRIYKELLLPDGDLHSDNKGRTRQFKWRNLTMEDSTSDMFGQNSDGEVEDDQDEDTQWRMKRYEREQWLKENKQKTPAEQVNQDEDDVVAEDENSQFVKFMKTAVQKNRKVKAPVTPTAAVDNSSNQQDKNKDKRVSTPKAIKSRAKFHGSFLHRKNEVAKIAANTMANPNGPRMSHNFIFKAVSPDPKNSDSSRPQVKRSSSISHGSMPAPKAKRPRLDRSQSTSSQSSIFNHL